jgi:predicted lipoprotein with Yx(FWY)xxD motif
MTRSRPMTFLAGTAVIPLAALVVAGCGGGGGASASAKPPKTTTIARVAAVRVANSRLGKILVDSQGHTLYLFKKDSGRKSACFGACATFWPPLRTNGKPTVGTGASASLIGTTARSDGAAQVTYNGHPLYRFAKDKKPGDTKGEGLTAFGGRWFVVSAAGNQVSPKPVSHQASTSGASSGAATPAPTPPPAAPAPAPAPAPQPAPPAPQASPPSQGNGIPQNGGGDGDADNNGGPSDGDGNV